MPINLFKISQKDKMSEELLSWKKAEKIIQSGEFSFELYYHMQLSDKLNWKSVAKMFDVNLTRSSSTYNGVILIHHNDDLYGIAYGNSSYILQKYCDENFAFDFAKRIKLKELKRKSSASHKNFGQKSSASVFSKTNILDIDNGDIITSLAFLPENELYGKRIDVGKSIKFQTNFDTNDAISNLITNIEAVIANDIVLNKLPMLVKVTDEKDIRAYNSILINDITTNYNACEVFTDELQIIGSSIFFGNDDSMVLTINKRSFHLSEISITAVFSILSEHNIDFSSCVKNGKITFYDENGNKKYSEEFYNFLCYDINDQKVSLYEGKWYYYNSDFLEMIDEGIKKITVKYDNVYDDIIAKSHDNEGMYKEDKINHYLSTVIPNSSNLDRNLFIEKFENEVYSNRYKIELADLLIDNTEFVAVKQGNDNKAFNYCFEQSILSMEILKKDDAQLTNITKCDIKTFCCWLFMNNIPFDSTGNVNLNLINSIMLKRKMCQWYREITTNGYIAMIRVNKK